MMRGCIFGVALFDFEAGCYLVSVSCDGELMVFDVGTRRELVRRCLERGWRVYASLGLLVEALEAGLCFGVSPRLLRDIQGVPLGSESAPYGEAVVSVR